MQGEKGTKRTASAPSSVICDVSNQHGVMMITVSRSHGGTAPQKHSFAVKFYTKLQHEEEQLSIEAKAELPENMEVFNKPCGNSVRDSV